MTNWKQLSDQEQDEIWNKFYPTFNFRPSVSEEDFPSILSSLPLLKFDISNCYSTDFPLDKLEQIALKLFDKISNTGDRLYALDWQHECFDFDPRKFMDLDERNEWIIPIFPNGDYYIFLTKDFKNMWFGHPWEQTITLVGNEIVKFGTEMIPEFNALKIKTHNKG